MSNKKIELLLVDDHQVMIDGLSAILNESDLISVKATALSGLEALRLMDESSFDVLLTDINMPEMDGINLISEVKERGYKLKVLVLTMHNDPRFTKKLIQMDVEGCLLKNTGREELWHAIQEVNNGDRYYGRDVTETLFTSIKHSSTDVESVQLSKRELQIVGLICKEFTNQEIASELCISIRTIEVHKSNIISKLKVKNVVGLVRFAINNGLID